MVTRFPATAHESASLWTAWDRLHGKGTQHLVVVDDHQHLVGVLDERTIALEWPPGPMGAHRTPVRTLLRGRARSQVRSDEDLATVARTMLRDRVDAVAVVDRNGRLFGLVTLWHLAGLAADGGRDDVPRRSTARPTGQG
ncbi:HPP family protein [Modestobacter sp. I12A-02662]|uniref:CBS domain-containing protein n=1 Tax=Modestobacter sp. I12A-02662 TaxID=1730496 RepID=UPI0034E00213